MSLPRLFPGVSPADAAVCSRRFLRQSQTSDSRSTPEGRLRRNALCRETEP